MQTVEKNRLPLKLAVKTKDLCLFLCFCAHPRGSSSGEILLWAWKKIGWGIGSRIWTSGLFLESHALLHNDVAAGCVVAWSVMNSTNSDFNKARTTIGPCMKTHAWRASPRTTCSLVAQGRSFVRRWCENGEWANVCKCKQYRFYVFCWREKCEEERVYSSFWMTKGGFMHF